MKKIIVAVVLLSMVFFSCKTSPNASGGMGSEKFKTKLTIPMLGNVFSVAISPDNKQIAAESANGCKIFDLKTAKEILAFEKNDTYRLFKYNPKGSYFSFWDSESHEIKIHDIKTGSEIQILQAAWTANYVYSPDGKHLANMTLYAGKTRDYITIWDVNTGNELWAISDDGTRYNTLSFSSDGKHIYCFDSNTHFHSYNTETGIEENTCKIPVSGGSGFVAIAPDGSQLITILSKDGKYFPQLWDAKNGRLLSEYIGNLPLSVEPKVVIYNSKGTKIFLGLADGTIRAYSSTTGREIAVSGYNAIGGISALNFSKNGKYLVVGTANGNITLLGK